MSRLKKTRNQAARNCLRLVDANLNRAKEALRVCEDISRFIYDDAGVTKRLKKCRHALTIVLNQFPFSYRELLNDRKSASDVGKASLIMDRQGKTKINDLWIANQKRAQEALRVLEEISKMIAPKCAAHFQRIRFETYDVERRVLSQF